MMYQGVVADWFCFTACELSTLLQLRTRWTCSWRNMFLHVCDRAVKNQYLHYLHPNALFPDSPWLARSSASSLDLPFIPLLLLLMHL